MDGRYFILKNKAPGGFPGYKSKVLRVAKMAFFNKGLVWVKLIKHGGLEHPFLLCPTSMRHLVIDVAHCFPLAGHIGKNKIIVGHESELRQASEEEELRSRLMEEFSRLRRGDEARMAARVGSLASLVSRPATENPEEGSADLE